MGLISETKFTLSAPCTEPAATTTAPINNPRFNVFIFMKKRRQFDARKAKVNQLGRQLGAAQAGPVQPPMVRCYSHPVGARSGSVRSTSHRSQPWEPASLVSGLAPLAPDRARATGLRSGGGPYRWWSRPRLAAAA